MDTEAVEERAARERHTVRSRAARGCLGRGFLIALSVLLGLVGVLGLADLAYTGSRVHQGVTAGGVPVGGLSEREAAVVLARRLAQAEQRPVALHYRHLRWSLDPARFSLDIDPARTAHQAWLLGRSGGVARSVWQRVRAWVAPAAVPVSASLNQDAAARAIVRMRTAIDKPAVSADLRMRGIRVVRVRASTGVAVHRRRTRLLIFSLMTSAKDRAGVVPTRRIPAGIEDEALDDAYAKAGLMMRRPLYLRYAGASWRVSRAAIGRWIMTTRRVSMDGGAHIVVDAKLDRARVERSLAKMTRTATVPAQDAVFAVDGEKVRIIPSTTGTGADTYKAYMSIRRAVASRGPRLVALSAKTFEPRLTTRRAKSMGIKTRLATYTTSYDSEATSRVNNIHLLAGSLNNRLVAPGKSFSFNRTIGPRTAAKGYQEAPAIVGGQLVPSVGGGVCQVATTMFNALFFSGLKVTERHNHSFYISHYPDGRDATVSYGGPDLGFANDTPAWVLLKASWGDDWVTISVYGGDVGNEVSYRTSDFRNYVPAPLERVPDPAMYVGRSVVEDEGIRGRDITVWRTVTRWGKVIHQDEFESHYGPRVGSVRVGTKRRPKGGPSKEPTPTPRR